MEANTSSNASNDRARTTTFTFRQPALPPLYFSERGTNTDDCGDDERQQASASAAPAPRLPSELLARCLAGYADWGDLAKLACVQKSWSNILIDAAEYRPESKWELAQALRDGACGLQRNPKRAVEICYDLAQLETTKSDTQYSTSNDNDGDDQPLAEARLPMHAEEEENEDFASAGTANDGCFAPALQMIAECYFTGSGLPLDPEAGMAWMQAAYRRGDDADAAHKVALTYEYGQYGVETDVVAAAEWFQKAASAGHIEAMAELALCYELGCGVEQSDEEALDWYTKAANAGHVTAKFSVAEAFEEARGVPQSDEEACLWYYRAAVLGDEDSKRALRRLYDIARIVCPGVNRLLDV